ncbi:arsenic metallochaperone ArsD family protein [Sorangium sp. KYC3313]|uniref:arsenic metallochaperone ArsD family protein n=1 Tax=Sorangium sp. KYC3313 TaxID=3449740 RepID=UPI003F8867A2
MSVTIRVSDPAMCCSTGVCGPSVDPELARFAGDVDWLQKQGGTVERYNLSQQPSAFTGSHEEKLARVIEVRESLRARIASWLASLPGTDTTPRTTTRN